MPTKRRQLRAVREPKKNVLSPGVVKPHARTITQVVNYLEHIGLSVYGANHTLPDGDLYLGQRDYRPQDVITYRRLWHNNTLGNYPVDLED
jgi:hypothetical protein